MESSDALDHLKQTSRRRPLTRREFMAALGTAAGAGPGLMAAALGGLSLTGGQRAEAREMIAAGLGKLPRHRLGAHMGGMEVTPICITQEWNDEVIALALSVGVNFVHKAGYYGSRVPQPLRSVPRESYYTDITVDNTSPGHDPDNYDEAYNQVVQSLDRNGLKYYDIFRAHYGWTSVDHFNKGVNASYRAFQRLKREGKARYFGVSQHPWVPYPEIIGAEVESGRLASMQVWYSYGTSPEAQAAFARASQAGIGMTAMKVYAHGAGRMAADPARMRELRAEGQVGRALMRHVLTQKRPDGKPIFSTAVALVGNVQVFEEVAGAFSPGVAERGGFTGELSA